MFSLRGGDVEPTLGRTCSLKTPKNQKHISENGQKGRGQQPSKRGQQIEDTCKTNMLNPLSHKQLTPLARSRVYMNNGATMII